MIPVTTLFFPYYSPGLLTPLPEATRAACKIKEHFYYIMLNAYKIS